MAKPGSPWSIREADYPVRGSWEQRAKFLIRYAILAPSTNNTQPWRFRITGEGIELSADRERWLKFIDRDQRELEISLGCALETLLVAAEHFGFGHDVEYLPPDERSDVVAFVRIREVGRASAERGPELFRAITVQRTNFTPYSASIPIRDAILARLLEICVEDDVMLTWLTDRKQRKAIAQLAMTANLRLWQDASFRTQAAQAMLGRPADPPGLVAKLMQWMLNLMRMGKETGDYTRRAIKRAPVFAALSTRSGDRRSNIRVGQVYQRISLLAAGLKILAQPIGQLVQLPDIQWELADMISPPGTLPRHVFRLGYYRRRFRPRSRRDVSEVLTR